MVSTSAQGVDPTDHNLSHDPTCHGCGTNPAQDWAYVAYASVTSVSFKSASNPIAVVPNDVKVWRIAVCGQCLRAFYDKKAKEDALIGLLTFLLAVASITYAVLVPMERHSGIEAAKDFADILFRVFVGFCPVIGLVGLWVGLTHTWKVWSFRHYQRIPAKRAEANLLGCVAQAATRAAARSRGGTTVQGFTLPAHLDLEALPMPAGTPSNILWLIECGDCTADRKMAVVGSGRSIDALRRTVDVKYVTLLDRALAATDAQAKQA